MRPLVTSLATGVLAVCGWAASVHASDILHSANYCQPQFAYSNHIAYNNYGAYNNGAAAEKVECPFSLPFSGALTVDKVYVTVYDRSNSGDVQCTVRGIDMAGKQLWASTVSSSGSGSAHQFLTADIDEATIGTMHMACLVPGKQGSAVSVVSTYRVVTAP